VTGGTDQAPVLEVVDLTKHFPVKKGIIRRTVGQVYAVDGVSFRVGEGETLGLVGESGCGKSTVARTVLRLLEPTGGTIRLDGRDITHLPKSELRPYRREMQIIFQDPFSSLNPRMSAGDIVGEPLQVHDIARGKAKDKMAAELFDQVGLRRSQMSAFPHEFSGGQRQRISIARALAGNPRFLVCDEPTSALDVSVQAQVLNLMRRLQRELGLTLLFISHNLAVVHHVADRVGVMYLGRIVELAPTRGLFASPQHPYTRMLLAAVPDLSLAAKPRTAVGGEVPNPLDPPTGCAFHPRCPHANERCRREVPLLLRAKAIDGDSVACHAVEEGRLEPAAFAAV